ncbi:MAG: HAD family hydrolase [Acidimicrobiales bacterium]
MSITVVGLDADDTLWHSESHFAVTEERFRALLEPWLEPGEVADRLLRRERDNLQVFGYGAKGFTLSMIETALDVSGGELPAAAVRQIIDWGKELSRHPVELLDHVADTIDALRAADYRLLLITKGDLFHQESKIAESGLADQFERVEILSEKSPATYQRVLSAASVSVEEFVMVGNSVRSDVLPVIEIGARAVHVPYGITWAHEADHDADEEGRGWPRIDRLDQLLPLLPEL